MSGRSKRGSNGQTKLRDPSTQKSAAIRRFMRKNVGNYHMSSAAGKFLSKTVHTLLKDVLVKACEIYRFQPGKNPRFTEEILRRTLGELNMPQAYGRDSGESQELFQARYKHIATKPASDQIHELNESVKETEKRIKVLKEDLASYKPIEGGRKRGKETLAELDKQLKSFNILLHRLTKAPNSKQSRTPASARPGASTHARPREPTPAANIGNELPRQLFGSAGGGNATTSPRRASSSSERKTGEKVTRATENDGLAIKMSLLDVGLGSGSQVNSNSASKGIPRSASSSSAKTTGGKSPRSASLSSAKTTGSQQRSASLSSATTGSQQRSASLSAKTGVPAPTNSGPTSRSNLLPFDLDLGPGLHVGPRSKMSDDTTQSKGTRRPRKNQDQQIAQSPARVTRSNASASASPAKATRSHTGTKRPAATTRAAAQGAQTHAAKSTPKGKGKGTSTGQPKTSI